MAFGHFVTVWKKQTSGEWKALIDLGITHPQAGKRSPITSSTVQLKKLRIAGSPDAKKELLNTETQFISAFAKNPATAYAKVLSSESRIYRKGNLPYVSIAEKKQVIEDMEPSILYSLLDGDIASSQDLAFVYGTATVNTTKDGKPQTTQASYMRIWKKEDGRHWRIVLDVLN